MDDIGPSLADKLESLGAAYRGLESAAKYYPGLKDTQDYIRNRVAELILSNELADEISSMTNPQSQAIAAQNVGEICNDLFDSDDYTSDWEHQRRWLGDAIVVASQFAKQ